MNNQTTPVKEDEIEMIAGILYANKSDEGDEGSWINSDDYYKVAEKIKAGYAASTPSEQGSDGWISVDGNELPLEKMILVSHKFGIDAIQFFDACWRHPYSGKVVDGTLLGTVTHYYNPKKPT